jgi:fido (protein-threonine AMPylation protein)/transcriptional regulator with XRE-family HTH domain
MLGIFLEIRKNMTNFVLTNLVMIKFSEALQNAREQKKINKRELATLMHVDSSMISRWESGARRPQKEQVVQLAGHLNLSPRTLITQWIGAQIIDDYKDFEYNVLEEAVQLVSEHLDTRGKAFAPRALPQDLRDVLAAIDCLKGTLSQFRDNDSYRIVQALELEYIHDSNRIEGNTLTLRETDLVINEGMTIAGKSMREHLEAINHQEAVELLKHLVKTRATITESTIKQLHNLILRGIDSTNAGKYRNVQVLIKGSKHIPPQPYLISQQMEDLIDWYNGCHETLHPVLLAAEFSERFVTIHPFIDGNGRTSRLLMNLILLQNGYVIANIKGDKSNRLLYYQALESTQIKESITSFAKFVAMVEFSCIQRYLEILGA